MLAKNFRAESEPLPHLSEIADSVFFASSPQMATRLAGLLVSLEGKCQRVVRGLPSHVCGDAYPMTDKRQAGVEAAEAMLARATKARAKVDFLKNMVKQGKRKEQTGVGQRQDRAANLVKLVMR